MTNRPGAISILQFLLATAADIVATKVHKFHKDCDEQVRCGVNIIISTADIVATKVYQF